MSPFTRDHHLSDLGLELLDLGELDATATAEARAHLDTCEACRARVAAMAAVAPPAPPLAAPPLRVVDGGRPASTSPPPPAAPPRTGWRWLAPVAGIAALAAGALSILVQPAPEPEFAVRGAGLDLEVFRDTEAGAEPLADRALVRPGDRLGFRVKTAEPGYVVVFGVDAAGAPWPAWPQGPAPEAERLEPGASHALPAAVRLDDGPGGERVVAVRCAERFAFADVAAHFPASGAPSGLAEGCVWSELRLTRPAP